MSRTTDVIVAGSGLAGLMAALAAAKQGASVKVVSEGMGNLAISPGCIDLLGYDTNGQLIADPWQEIGKLPPEHPYSLLGEKVIGQSMHAVSEAAGAKGYSLTASKDESGNHVNSLVPTIMGTLKPTLLYPADSDLKTLDTAKKVLILSVKGFRDCRPQLIASQLRRYKSWADKDFDTLVLPAPFTDNARSINALDIAHFLDRPIGADWLMNRIKNIGKNHDLVLLPPILGAKANSSIREVARQNLGCPYVELLSVPPGVGGMRLRHALVDTLVDLGVEFYENAQITSSVVQDGKAVNITLRSTGRDTTQEAKTFVIATGGIIGGGLLMGQGSAKEAIFNVDVPVPENVDEWSDPKIFGKHLISRLGVTVDKNLQVPDLANVYFAGRILGGYDYAAEKSGHGVACASGWQAGLLAASQAKGGE